MIVTLKMVVLTIIIISKYWISLHLGLIVPNFDKSRVNTLQSSISESSSGSFVI